MRDPSPPTAAVPFEARLRRATSELWRRAAAFDVDGADPAELCAPLAQQGLFVDALPHAADLAQGDAQLLRRTLTAIGGADLSAGRIFEGHVNAVKLVLRYGDAGQARALAADVAAGAVCGVWNAEAPPGLRLDRAPDGEGAGVLAGAKIYASGLGLVTRPLLTARTPRGEVLMLVPRFEAPPAGDLSAWTVRGMRATATGTVDLTGLRVTAADVVGAAGDYYRAPLFKGGAWRFAAVQTGGVLRLLALMTAELRARGRDGDPHQRTRIGQAAIAAQTCELWVARAAATAEDPAADPAAAEAYVNLARLAVERCALEVVALAERGLGLSAFTRPNPIERVARDLATYLRQPFPDAALEDAAAYVAACAPAPPWSDAAEFAA